MIISKEDKERIIKEFCLHGEDTGSMKVQVALLTHCIRGLTEHCKKHPKDFSSKRGLLQMVNRRRSNLDYIARKDRSGYAALIQQLGLRK